MKVHGALFQVELAGITGLSPATVSNIVKELSSTGVLHTTLGTHSGRRAQRVTLAHRLGLVAGVHIAPRHLRVALADTSYTIVAEHHMPLAMDHRADNELDRTALMLADMLTSVDSGMHELLSVGVSIAGPIDRASGAVARRGILRGWDGIPIAESLAGRLQRPVHVDNAANLAALAESRSGAGRGKLDSITLDIGEGIGAGLIVNGRLLRGYHGVAGEFGHMIVDRVGPVCRCGNRGCLEAVAAAPAVLRSVEEAGRALKLSDVIVRAMSGDARSTRAIADAGRTIGFAAAGLCNLLDPERVIVGGEFAKAGELLIGPLRHALESALLVEADGTPDVVQAQLGDRASVLGALALAIEPSGVGAA